MSGSILKLIACVVMLADHIAVFAPSLIQGIDSVIFCIGSEEITLQYLMHAVGRWAFPIFSFLIAEGFMHTRNRTRYAVNLFLFALVSEIPFNLACSGDLMFHKQNIFFTLFLGFLGICCLEQFNATRRKKFLLYMLALFIISVFLKADYGCFGFGFIVLIYTLRNNRFFMAVLGSCVLPSRWIGGLAFIPICFYNGKRGFATGLLAKYAFYAFYPLHLLLIYTLCHI